MRNVLILAVCLGLAGCANFRAAGTFQYEGDNMRAGLACKPASDDRSGQK